MNIRFVVGFVVGCGELIFQTFFHLGVVCLTVEFLYSDFSRNRE